MSLSFFDFFVFVFNFVFLCFTQCGSVVAALVTTAVVSHASFGFIVSEVSAQTKAMRKNLQKITKKAQQQTA